MGIELVTKPVVSTNLYKGDEGDILLAFHVYNNNNNSILHMHHAVFQIYPYHLISHPLKLGHCIVL